MKFRLGLNKEDLRATLPNIMQLLNIFSKAEKNSTRSYVPKPSLSGSSTDLMVPTNKLNKDDKRLVIKMKTIDSNNILFFF